MDYFKVFIIIVFTSLVGIFLGTYIYKASKIEEETVFNETYSIYMLQYGVYKNADNMKKNTTNLPDYFFFKDKDGYHVIIGIIENKDLSSIITKSMNIKNEDIYLKEIKVSNMEFIESLRQYDNLISTSKDDNFIINAEKQILSKYEELVLNNE